MVLGLSLWLWVGVPVLLWWVGYGLAAWRTARVIPPEVPTSLPPAAVLIAARNEASNLRKFLPHLLQQQYPGAWSVWVINDHSTDDSIEVLDELQSQYPHLQVITLREGEAGKKDALQAGISASTVDFLVFTDADAWPASPHWLMHMVLPLVKGADAVVGFSPAYTEQRTWLAAFQQYDYAQSGLLYLSATHLGFPYMAVGRNMGYTRAMYQRVGGVTALPDTLSGSDDLLLQRMAAVGKVADVAFLQAWMYTLPKATFHDWAHQKSRHLSVGGMYSTTGKWWLGAWMTGLILYYTFLIGLTFHTTWWIVVGIHLVRSGTQLLIFDRWSAGAYRLFPYRWLPLLDLFMAIYVICGIPLLRWRNPKTWN